MSLDDKGSFFMKKVDGSVWIVIYSKTNYLLKSSNPIIRENKKPNKIFAGLFDKDGRDYIIHNMPIKEFKTKILNNKENSEIYDYNKNTSKEIYDKMKDSGLDKFYTKKWFDKQYNFIKEQIKN